MPSTKFLILSLFLITIASIQDALGAHEDHHRTGSEIRRLGRHPSRGGADRFLKGGEQANSYQVFIGIPSASQVTPMTTSPVRHRHPDTFYAKTPQPVLYALVLRISIPSPAQARRAAIRETWGKTARESFGSEVKMLFYVHEDSGTRGAHEESEARFGDVVYTRDGPDELDRLAAGQEGVTQRVSMPSLHVEPCLHR